MDFGYQYKQLPTRQDLYIILSPLPLTSLTVPLPVEGTWEKLSQLAVKGAEYDSLERRPHSKCLEGTRVGLLHCIHGFLDDREKSRLIWLHGTAGVGKSAVAFTVAERMRALRVTDYTTIGGRLAGTFFFSRKHTKRCTTGYFFVTLAYQLASNYPSVREDVNKAIRDNPALLNPNESLHDQMEVLFLQPLRKLRFRLCGCPPLVYVVDALDECTSETKVAELIFLLGRALRSPELPTTHVVLTSRLEAHIREAIQKLEVQQVEEISVDTSGAGVVALDGTEVDNDIYIFLQHSFTELENRYSGFLQPPKDQLARLASPAGRLFIVASTIMRFIDDRDNDPCDRLQLMLELTSELPPGREVYKLYDRILATCADPPRAFMYLSIVAALADPLPISQISELLGPSHGRDVETTLVQLRSIMDIPSDSHLPVNIYHSSVRDYASNPLNYSLPQVQYITPPHSLLAQSSFRLMMRDIPQSTALLDALSELEKQSQALQPHDPQSLQQTLAFVVQPPESLRVLISLLWIRGDRSLELQSWLETLDGRAWLQTQRGKDWLQTQRGHDWLETQDGLDWLPTQDGLDWLQTQGGRHWLQAQGWLDWLPTQDGRDWLQTQGGTRLAADPGWTRLAADPGWTRLAADPRRTRLAAVPGDGTGLQTQGGRVWLQTESGRDWVQTLRGRDWLQTPPGRVWMQTQGGARVDANSGRAKLAPDSERTGVAPDSERAGVATGPSGQEWTQSWSGKEWLKSQPGQRWVQSKVRPTQLHTQARRAWLQIQHAEARWLDQFKDAQCRGEHEWLQSQGGREWLQTEDGQSWLQTCHDPGAAVDSFDFFLGAMEEFSSTLEAIREYTTFPELPLPAFQVIQQFKNLPDFLAFPVFLALRHIDRSASEFPRDRFLPDVEIVHAMAAFAMGRKRSTGKKSVGFRGSEVCMSELDISSLASSESMGRWAPPHIQGSVFWDHHLSSWFEAQWCLKGLQPCPRCFI